MIAEVLDLGIDLNIWPWVWLFVGIVFAIIELTVLAGTFVLLPFAVSALFAALLGFYEVAIEIQWAVFIAGGALMWVALYKRVMKFTHAHDSALGVGAERLVGMSAIVTADIDPDDTERRGRVKVEGEVWSALSTDDRKILAGAKVRVTSMHGTRVKVEQLIEPSTGNPPSGPPISPVTPPGTSPGHSTGNTDLPRREPS